MGKMNWEKEAGNEYIIYPDGMYKVKITGYEETKASTGTPQIRWKAQIVEPAEFVGKPFTMHTAMTDKAIWRIAKLVRGCGIDLKGLSEMDIGSSAFFKVLNSCVNRTAYWRILVRPDNKGNDRNEVEDFKVDEEQGGEVANDDDVPEFLK